MKRWQSTLWTLLVVCIVVGIPFVLYGTLSTPFTPPAPDSAEAKLPPMPVMPRASDSAAAAKSPGVPEEAEAAAEDLDSDRVAMEVKAFYGRHPASPEAPFRYRPESVREDFFDIGYAVLQRRDPDRTLLQFVRHPDSSVRMAAVDALCAAWNALNAEGGSAMAQFLARQSQADLEALMIAATEAILQDTAAGTLSRMQMLLMFLGDYGRPAVPHLVWVSNNHPEADMRLWCMNTATMLEPNAAESWDLILRHLADPDGSVRLGALQAVLMRPLQVYALEHGNVPPWYLQLRPGDAAPGVGAHDLQKHV